MRRDVFDTAEGINDAALATIPVSVFEARLNLSTTTILQLFPVKAPTSGNILLGGQFVVTLFSSSNVSQGD